MRLLLLSLLLAVVGCTSVRPVPEAADPALTGTVTYLQRIALPPDAVVTVRLLDVGLADAPSVTLAEQTIRPEGRNVPIPYALSYAPDRVDARHRYVVRAEIRDEVAALKAIAREERNTAIAEMLRRGASWSQVQHATGCSRATIAKIAKRMKAAS